MLNSLIDLASVELESAQSLVGSIGLDLKLCLKYYSGLPRAAERVVCWGVFQVVARLAPWVVLPAAALGLKGLNQCQEPVFEEFCKGY